MVTSRFQGDWPVPLAPEGGCWGESDARKEERLKAEGRAHKERKAMFGGWDENRDVEHKGFRIAQATPEHIIYGITTLDGSPLPDELKGKWTTMKTAVEAIDSYKEKETAEGKDGNQVRQSAGE